MPRAPFKCHVARLGRIDYDYALEVQMKCVELVQADPAKSFLLLLSHNHVYTLGRRGARSNILVADEALERIGAKVRRIHRGGDVTYHGPGQIVGYPILSLTRHGLNIRKYFDCLEKMIIDALAAYGIEGRSVAEYPGAWVGEEKVAAIGVGVKRWVAFHGFALNANTDLEFFRRIVPCGIRGKEVTTMARLLGKTVDEESLVKHIEEEFLRRFNMQRDEEVPDFLKDLCVSAG